MDGGPRAAPTDGPARRGAEAALEDEIARLTEPDGPGRRARRGTPGRPRVTVSYAQSLDGSIALVPGEMLRLSGDRALSLTHRLRARHDAILVGIGTVLADDPRLTVRFAVGRNPVPVVLDSRLRLPGPARLLADAAAGPGAGGRRLLVAATADAPEAAAERLAARGAEVLRFAPEEGRVPLRPLLRALARRGVRRLLVEGGSRVLTSLFAARLADCVVVTVAPRLLGGEPALARVPAPVALGGLAWARFGDDLVFAGRPRFARSARSARSARPGGIAAARR